MSDRKTIGNMIPCLSYRDAEAAMKWLTRAFDFQEKMIVRGDANRPIMHAEMTCGNGMIMLGTLSDDEFGKRQRTPNELGAATCTPYVVVADLAAHHARAVEGGAEIIMPIRHADYGSSYMARDPDGHIWCFGDYDPWA